MTQDLIRQLQQEYSDELFEQLYRIYTDKAIRTATAITRSSASAADVVQETFMRVYRNLNTFDLNKPFEPWFNRILVNECNRYLEKHSRLVRTELTDERVLPAQHDRYNFDEHGDIYDMVQRLEDQQRIPIILKYVNDYAEKDIAEMLDLNVNTVKSRLYKARQKLQGWLRLNGGGEQDGS
ncbi:RNA polymerase sigma factor [Paenibacillus urinalis]|uniref:Sigma-70 family RNA polymerase sigma factor n=1 Tax=Paenibacillus urinalis TaxID=521520 RepID=A0AAX3N2Q4_9BACL|nr:sigma-70 family RNA polymerase sigma factor [Paenibacillus urinalis]WDH82897.1 sigma-70 family RNA polymerase sigma factor [Paenibacillus urinalis]